MADPVIPVVIRGPAVIIRDSNTFYTQGNIAVKRKRPTFDVVSDMFGKIDTRVAGVEVTEIEFTPVGEIENMAKYFPYGPTSLVSTVSIGTSIFGAADVSTVIHTKAGQTITYSRTAITKTPTLNLSPKKTIYGPMTITAIGKSSTQPNTDGYIKTIAATAFSDTSFDPTKIKTSIYSAALGTRTAPYNAMGAREGFEVECALETDEVQDDSWGVVDMILASMKWTCKFAPNNLTEAQVDALVNSQGTSVIKVGESVAKGPAGVAENLVITGDNLVVTLNNVGIVTAEHGYGAKIDRNGTIEFTTKAGFTTGAMTAMASLVAS